MSSSKSPKKVLIVGAGPTGLTSAFELARRGILPEVIDAKQGIASESRATGISVSSLELLEDSGVTPLLIAEGVKVKKAQITPANGENITLNFDDLQQKYNFLLCLPQYRTEAIMQKKFEELGGNVQYSTKLLSLKEKEDGTVEAVMEKEGKSLTETFNAVIGADGVKSTVRQQANIELEGNSYPDKWSAAEFDSKEWPHPGEVQYFFGKGGNFAVVIPLRDNRYRAIANTEDAMACISGRQPVDLLLFNTTFRVGERHANTYQKGNIFLAGDAAHAYPPAGVQGGMNLGIKDACSLARRIAEDDIKGYTKERRAVGAATIRDSRRMVRIAGMKNSFICSARNTTLRTALRVGCLRNRF
jgi:2-polyprenyl-6-methoxyphenol hydroxylase-like FAD-dependent oxidoreductase